MSPFWLFENRIPLKPKLGACAASQTTVMHMERLNQTKFPIFVILCVLCFQRQSYYHTVSGDYLPCKAYDYTISDF